jgi:hypothetical protein
MVAVAEPAQVQLFRVLLLAKVVPAEAEAELLPDTLHQAELGYKVIMAAGVALPMVLPVAVAVAEH